MATKNVHIHYTLFVVIVLERAGTLTANARGMFVHVNDAGMINRLK